MGTSRSGRFMVISRVRDSFIWREGRAVNKVITSSRDFKQVRTKPIEYSKRDAIEYEQKEERGTHLLAPSSRWWWKLDPPKRGVGRSKVIRVFGDLVTSCRLSKANDNGVDAEERELWLNGST